MFPESEINGDAMMIDIERYDYSFECATNTVEIRFTREKSESIITKESSDNSPAYPNISYLLLENIASFDSDNMYRLLCSTLQNPILCRHLSDDIAFEAEPFLKPLSISLHVILSPQKSGVVVGPPPRREKVDDTETCAICLVEERSLFELPNCSHVFHDYCIDQWLSTSNTCPLCRAEILSDDE